MIAVGQLIAELNEYNYDLPVVIEGKGEIVEIEITDCGYVILKAEQENDE